jgi:hypothetical protein
VLFVSQFYQTFSTMNYAATSLFTSYESHINGRHTRSIRTCISSGSSVGKPTKCQNMEETQDPGTKRRLAFFLGVGWDWVHLVRRPLTDLSVPAADHTWWWTWSSRWNEKWQGKPKYSEKTYPSATLPTTNTHDLTWARSRLLTAWAMARPRLGLPDILCGLRCKYGVDNWQYACRHPI